MRSCTQLSRLQMLLNVLRQGAMSSPERGPDGRGAAWDRQTWLNEH